MTEAEWRKLPLHRRLTGVERRRLGQLVYECGMRQRAARKAHLTWLQRKGAIATDHSEGFTGWQLTDAGREILAFEDARSATNQKAEQS